MKARGEEESPSGSRLEGNTESCTKLSEQYLWTRWILLEWRTIQVFYLLRQYKVGSEEKWCANYYMDVYMYACMKVFKYFRILLAWIAALDTELALRVKVSWSPSQGAEALPMSSVSTIYVLYFRAQFCTYFQTSPLHIHNAEKQPNWPFFPLFFSGVSKKIAREGDFVTLGPNMAESNNFECIV